MTNSRSWWLIRAVSLACMLPGAAALGQGTVTAKESGEPAPVVLGKRIEESKKSTRIRGALIIARDSASYLKALSHWKLAERYPVLIDDGSDLARENIARFIRAFEPSQVLVMPPAAEALPAASDAEGRRKQIEGAMFASWGVKSAQELKSKWADLNYKPPGVVVVSPQDPAWAGGLAMAAFRGQPMLWLSSQPGDPGASMTSDELVKLDQSIIAGLDELGRPWKELGDEIDAVTLSLNVPSKYPGQAGGGLASTMALTDRIGRYGDGKRWGWCGQVFGDEATSLYRAMSGLFIPFRSAWAFDGYPAGGGFNLFSLKELPSVLAQTPITLAFDPSRTTIDAWRAACRSTLTQSMVYVNSRGQMWWFELNPGRGESWDRGYCWDIPLLSKPSLVYFTHSFSAAIITQRDTIGGRWFENGAFGYVGAVDEPYLGAFQPGVEYFKRMCVYGPIGASARLDKSPPWKVNVYADPLLTVGKTVARVEDKFAIEDWLSGSVTLSDQLTEYLKAGKLAEAASCLVMLGRDADAVRLALARPGPNTDPEKAKQINAAIPAMARIAIPAAFRNQTIIEHQRADTPELKAKVAEAARKNLADFLRLYEALPIAQRDDPFLCSLLWQLLRPGPKDEPGRDVVEMLRAHIRPISTADDAAAIAVHVKRIFGAQAMENMFSQLLAKYSGDAELKGKLNDLLADVRRK